MAEQGRVPQPSREPAKDLNLVHAVRTMAEHAARRRDQDPAWAELEQLACRWLERLGIELEVGGGGADTGRIDRTRLPGDADSRAALLAELHALEQDPTPQRLERTSDLLRSDAS